MQRERTLGIINAVRSGDLETAVEIGSEWASETLLALTPTPAGKISLLTRFPRLQQWLTRLAKLNCECFVAGTLIVTAHGNRPIEDIAVGDLVWSKDPDTGEEGYRPVTRVFVTPDAPIYQVHAAPNGGGEPITFEVTDEHPFYTSRGWVPATDLQPGDQLYSLHAGWLHVTGGTWTQRTATVYNFEVAEFHTYFVAEPGVWVHNSCCTRNLTQDLLDIRRQKGLGDIAPGTKAEAVQLGQAWVNGKNVRRFSLADGGFGLTDGTRTFRLQFKPKSGVWKANFQENVFIPGRAKGIEVKNIHMTITDMAAP